MTKPKAKLDETDPFGLSVDQDRKFNDLADDLEADAAAEPPAAETAKTSKPKGRKGAKAKPPLSLLPREGEGAATADDPRPADAGEMRVESETLGSEISEDFLDTNDSPPGSREDETEVERLAREQAEDDADPREQGPADPAKPKSNATDRREPDDLDDWSPSDDPALLSLTPESRRFMVRGLVSEALQRLTAINADVKKRGFPFDEDLLLVAKLATSAADLCAKTGLDFRGRRES